MRRAWWSFLLVSSSLLLLFPRSAAAQQPGSKSGGSVVPLCVSGCGGGGSYEASFDDGSTIAGVAHTTGQRAFFTLRNTGTLSDTYTLTCRGRLYGTCDSVRPASVSLGASGSKPITAYYTANDSGGSWVLSVTATGHVAASGSDTVAVGASAIALVAPSPGSYGTATRFVVHNRHPILRALYTGLTADSTKTTFTWRGSSVLSLIRHGARLAEWEVDSAHQLNIGDSAQWVLKACTSSNVCTTESHWVVLPSDSAPVVDFTGAPLEALSAGFSAPFGPGLALSGAEIETGLSTVPYVSMGTPRSTGLIYSTRTSYPRALVPVNVELPWPSGTPTQLKVVLWDGGIQLDAAVVASPSCLTGSTHACRVVLQGDFRSSTFSTPTRKWLEVQTSVTSGGVTKTTTDSTEVVLVDRRATRYGSGWWPSAFSEVVAAGNDRVLVAPDGAVTVYRGYADSSYLPPPGSFTTLSKVGSTWELHTRGTTAKAVFDANGRFLTTVDPNGNRDSLVYNQTSDELDSLIDPRGKALKFTYNGSGKLQKIALTGDTTTARALRVAINATTNQLTTDTAVVIGTHPQTTRYVYAGDTTDRAIVLTKTIGALNDTIEVVYDSTFQGRPVQLRLPALPVDTAGTVVTPTTAYTASAAQGFRSLRSLDSGYVGLTDPRGHWTRSLLNRWGEPLQTWDSLGTLSKATYTADGFPLTAEGKTGDSSRVTTVYDALERPVKRYVVRTASDTIRVDSLVYDAASRVVKHVNPLGQADSVGYDAHGNVTYVRAVNDSVTRTWYASDGVVDSLHLPATTGHTAFTYDPLWRNRLSVLLITATDRDSIVGTDTIHITADTLTQDSAFTDAWGRDTLHLSKIQAQVAATLVKWQWRKARTYFNAANQPDSTVAFHTDYCDSSCRTPPAWPAPSDLLNTSRVAYRYDAAGRDSLRLDNRGVTSRYRYDRLGRVVAHYPWADSSAVRDSTVYDVAGNVRRTVTRMGAVITSFYDSRNRDTLTIIPGLGSLHHAYAGPQDQLTHAWYTGYVDSIGDVTPTHAWVYDSAGRLLADSSFNGPTPVVATYGYDAYDRPTTLTDRNGTWATRYDPVLGAVDTLLSPFGDTLSYGYDGQGRVRQSGITGPSGAGLAGSQAYTDAGALSSRSFNTTGDTSAFTAGSWEALGLLGLKGGGSALAPKWSYSTDASLPDSPHHTIADTVGYDGWGRVNHWESIQDGTTTRNEYYTFDAAGNVTIPGGSTTLTYDSVTTRLTRLTAPAGVASTFAFDRAGNLVQRVDSIPGGHVTWSYGYDALSRLVTVRRGGTLVARYAYDVTGERIVRHVYSHLTGGTIGYTRYVYHGAQVAYETDSSGAEGWRYVWGPGTDHLVVARDSTGHVLDAVPDRLGSVRGWFNTATDSVVGQQLFTPYGTRVAIDSAPAYSLSSYGWTGREYDAETGFYYLRARYYDPFEYRFVQEDPTGYGGGANVYAYVGGAVLSATDPSGLFPSPDGAFKMDGYIWAGNPSVYAQDDIEGQGNPWAILDGSGSDQSNEGQSNVSGITVSDSSAVSSAGCPPCATTPGDASAESDNDRSNLEALGDFFAGFGDFWTGGGTELAREYLFPSLGDDVAYNSSTYSAGTITGFGSSLLLAGMGAAEQAGWRSKVAVHGAEHNFGGLTGYSPHIQVNTWWAGVGGSGWVWRFAYWFEW